MPQVAPKRLAKPEPQTNRRSPAKSTAIILYRILVIISAIIVGVYIALSLAIKPPEITDDPLPPVGDQSQTDAPDISASGSQVTPTGRVRRDLVYNFVLLGRDRESGNTDSIMVLSYDIPNQKVGVISIPRDTVVNRTWSKNPKINGAFAHSPETIKEEIKNTFGIPIDYYIYIKLDGFVKLVDQLGGVDVYIPESMNYDDPAQDLHIHYNKGQYHLNGQGAMEVVRFRKNNDGTGGTDVGRAAMQRQVLVELARKVLSWNSLPKVKEFIDIFNAHVKTDLSLTDMTYLATQAMSFDMSNLTQAVLDGRGDGYFKGWSWCYVYQAEDILPTLNETVNPYNIDLTAEDLDLPVATRYAFNY